MFVSYWTVVLLYMYTNVGHSVTVKMYPVYFKNHGKRGKKWKLIYKICPHHDIAHTAKVAVRLQSINQ